MAIGVGKLFRRTGKAAGSAGRAAGRFAEGAADSRTLLYGLGAAAVGIGALNIVAPAAKDAAFDVVMGDPNADVAFTGRDISTRYLVGRSMGGFTGRALQYFGAPTDTFVFQGPGAVDPRNTAATSGIAGVTGMAVGGSLGSMLGTKLATRKALKAGLSAPTGRGSLKSRLGLAAIGAIGGGMMGASLGPTGDFLQTRQLMRDNELFYSQSPYAPRNSTKSLVHSTNAVGDIVLGMHNSRGGY